MSQRAQRTTHSSDDLVSVTVRKTVPNQGPGMSLVSRNGTLVITSLSRDSLFKDTAVEVGDVLLSLNGKRIRSGETASDLIQAIHKSKATVSIVIKKADRKARRGVRSLSPTGQRKMRLEREKKKTYKGMRRFNPDGSLIIKYDPNHPAWANEDEEFDEIPVAATRSFKNQKVGVKFCETDNMIFVSNIAADSIFRGKDLQVGDRVVQINEMNFRTYATSKYAKKILTRAGDEVEFIIERGRVNFNESMASLEQAETSEEEDLQGSMSFRDRSVSRRGRSVEGSFGTLNTETSSDVDISRRQRQVTGFTIDEFEHDILKVTLRRAKKGQSYGVKVLKRGGKYLVKARPEEETRFNVGDEILAVNSKRVSELESSHQVESMIDKSPDAVALILNFDKPRSAKITCPCCHKLMRTDGSGHIEGSQHDKKARKLVPEKRTEPGSVAESEVTEQVANRKQGGVSGLPKGPEIPRTSSRNSKIGIKYTLEEFDSDSESDDNDGRPIKPVYRR